MFFIENLPNIRFSKEDWNPLFNQVGA